MLDLGSPRTFISIVLGVVIAALGGIPLLNKFGVLAFSLPVPEAFLPVILLIAGIITLVSGLWIYITATQFALLTLLFGVLTAVLGALSTLSSFGLFSFAWLPADPIMYHAILVVSGVLVFVSSFRH